MGFPCIFCYFTLNVVPKIPYVCTSQLNIIIHNQHIPLALILVIIMSLIDYSVKELRKSVEKQSFSKNQKFTTLVIDANSLYQEALLLSKTTPVKSVHQSMKEFFELLKNNNRPYRIEVIFSSVESFALELEEKCSLNSTIDDHVVDENALIAWEIMREHVLNYEGSGGCAYFSQEDNFTSMLEFAMRDECDLSKRVLCSSDPRFLFVLKDRWVVSHLFHFVKSGKKAVEEYLKNNSSNLCLWALLRVTDMALCKGQELNLGELYDKANRLLTDCSEITKDIIDKWLDICSSSNIKFKDDVTELFKKPHMFFYSRCPLEFARVSGRTRGTTLKILKNIFLERPIICGPHITAWRSHSSSSNSQILMNPLMKNAACFNAYEPIRMKFLSCSRLLPNSETLKMSDVLLVTRDGNEVSVLTEEILQTVLDEPNIGERSIQVSLLLLKASSGIDENEETQIRKLINKSENVKWNKQQWRLWLNFHCTIFHVFLAAEVCRNSLLISFPLLGEYQCYEEKNSE